MSYPSRVRTMRVLVDAHPIVKTSTALTAITGELARIEHARRRTTDGSWLLTVLHSTRALDTTLRTLLDGRGWTDGQFSLGGYLTSIHKRMPKEQSLCDHFKKEIAEPRNTYMHKAGAMPSRIEADALLAEMQACLTWATTRIR